MATAVASEGWGCNRRHACCVGMGDKQRCGLRSGRMSGDSAVLDDIVRERKTLRDAIPKEMKVRLPGRQAAIVKALSDSNYDGAAGWIKVGNLSDFMKKAIEHYFQKLEEGKQNGNRD